MRMCVAISRVRRTEKSILFLQIEAEEAHKHEGR